MPLASPGRLSATGVPFVVVDSMQLMFDGHVGWCPDTTPHGGDLKFEGMVAWFLSRRRWS